jgi:poly(A) polymerase
LFEARLQKTAGRDQIVQHQELAREVLRELLETLPVPRRVIDSLARAFDAQRRFNNPKARFSKKRFVLQNSFPDALFVRELVLRAQGENTGELRQWTTLRQQFQKEAVENGTIKPDAVSSTSKPAAKRRRRRRRKPAGSSEAPPTTDS